MTILRITRRPRRPCHRHRRRQQIIHTDHRPIAETFGADAQRYRLLAFILAAVIGAIAGWLYAHVQRFLNPTPFGLNASIDYLFMTVIGGSGQLWGALLGAGLVTIIKHELQDVLKLVDKLEQDEDVQKVFHNLQ